MVSSLVLLLIAAAPAPAVVAVAVTPNGGRAVIGSQAGIQVVSLPDLAVVGKLATKLEHVHDLAFSPRGNLLAAVGGSPGERGAAELWNWPALALQATLPAGDDVAYGVAWNAGGTHLAVAGGDKAVWLMAANPAGDGAPTHSVGAPVPATLRPHSAAVLAVAWLDDDLVLSAGVDQTIRVLKPASGETVRSLDNHTGAVRDLAVRANHANGPAVVASAGADRTVRFWQPAIGRLVRFARLPAAPTAICWTSSATHVLAACQDGRLRAVDYESLAITEFTERLDDWAHAVAVLPDGKSALLVGERGQLQIVRLDAINP